MNEFLWMEGKNEEKSMRVSISVERALETLCKEAK